MNQNNKNLDFSKDFESTNLSTNSPVQNFSLKKEEFKRKYQDKNRLLNFLKTNNPNFSEDFELIKFVSAGAKTDSADYFAQARLDRMNDRDTAVQTLQTMIGGGDVSEDEMVVNAIDAVQVSKLIESEGTIESLIKSQGFQDCVAYLDGHPAKVVVKTEGLDKAQAASIKEIILGETDIDAENIRIFEVK